MSLSQLANSDPAECHDLINKIIKDLFKDISSQKLTAFINSIFEVSLNGNIMQELLSQLLSYLDNIPDESDRYNYYKILYDLALEKNILHNKIKLGYIKVMRDVEMYNDAALLLSTFPIPDNETEALNHYLDLGELHFLNKNYSSAFTAINKASNFIFRQASPKDSLYRFDFLRGNIYMKQVSYKDAALAFFTALSYRNDLLTLRKAAIASILMPFKKEKRFFMEKIEESNFASQLDVISMIHLMSSGHFIDRASRDSFISLVKDEIDSEGESALASSCLESNIVCAKELFSTVSIDRLGTLLGESPQSITDTLTSMIQEKRINALLNQPMRNVIFLSEDDRIDGDIAKYCEAVESVTNEIELLLSK